MPTDLKGSAKGTLSGQNVTKPSDMESLLQSGTALASRLLTLYTTPPSDVKVDFSAFESGMNEAIQSAPAPQQIPVPSTPSGGSLAAGLIATALADRSGRGGGQSNPQLVAAVEGRRERAQEIEASNITAGNAAAMQKHAALLEVRRTILSAKIEQDMANQKAGNADKAAKELFVVNTALDQINKQLDHVRNREIAGIETAGRKDVARISGWIDYLSRLNAAKQGGPQSAEQAAQESAELKTLLDFMQTVDMKIENGGRDWTIGPDFGKKILASDEELSAQFRTIGAYMSSPWPRVRLTAEQNLDAMLKARFGSDTKAAEKWMIEQGVNVTD